MDGIKEGARLAVGSLAYLDPGAAVKTQLMAFPDIPSWPQLPRKSPKERMTVQGLSDLPGLTWPTPEQAIWTVPPTDFAEVLEQLKGEGQAGRLERAAFKPEEAAGFFAFLKEAGRPSLSAVSAVKGQIAGPVTLGRLIQDENGKPLLSSRGGMEILREYLLMNARWQARELSHMGKPLVLFLDEPGLGTDFQPGDYGLDWKDVQGLFSEMLEPLQEEGILTGIHTCAPGPWNWVFDSPAEIFHFDGYRYLSQVQDSAKEFNSFFRKGGMVAWGMVPTFMDKGTFPDPAELLHRWVDLYHVLIKKGVRPEDLKGRSLFSTSCGLGNSSVSVSEEATRCLGALHSLWKMSAEEEFKA